MGVIHTTIELANPRLPDMKPMEVKSLVDTGALLLCIPPHIATQLKLETLEERETIIADGSSRRVPYVGPLQVRFDNRSCFTGALVLGDEVLLGAVPMEDLDILVHPKSRKAVVNPDSPNIPTAITK